jgi:hypothetical protein
MAITFFSLTSSTVTSSQTCVPPPTNLVSWWPEDGNADDSVGANDGTLQNGATFGLGNSRPSFQLGWGGRLRALFFTAEKGVAMTHQSHNTVSAFLVGLFGITILCVLAYTPSSGHGSYAPAQQHSQPPLGVSASWPLDDPNVVLPPTWPMISSLTSVLMAARSPLSLFAMATSRFM